jgi:type IV pilus assembly protein PilN
MIRINLLQVERHSTTTKSRGAGLNLGSAAAAKVPLLCSLIFVAAIGYVGYSAWSLFQRGQRLEVDLQQAREEEAKLQPVLRQFEAFEARKKQLQDRVNLIEELRRGQGVAVHLLDEISKSVPDRLWLTDLKQQNEFVVMDGQTSTLTAISDFIGNLESTGYFKRPIEIISTQEDKGPTGLDLIRFQMKAEFVMPGPAPVAQTASLQAPGAPGAPGTPAVGAPLSAARGAAAQAAASASAPR